MLEKIINEEDKKEKDREFEISPLSRLEFLFYIAFWFYVVLSGCYQFHKLLYNKITLGYFLNKGMIVKTYFGLYKNVQEDSWSHLQKQIIYGWPYFLFYLLVSRLLRSITSPKIFMSVCVIISIYINYQQSSYKYLKVQIIIFVYSMLAGLIRSKTLVWTFNLSMLYYYPNLVDYINLKNQYLFYFGYSTLALLITRGISIGLVIAEAPKFSFQLILETCFYYWYFPALFGVRMMVARDFIAQIYRPYVVENWKVWWYASLRLVIYLLCWDVIVNLVNVKLVLFTHDVNYMTMTALIGCQIFYGLHYYMIFLIMYKGGYLMAQFDGFLTSVGPECIAHIALYSRMWRNFDTAMHDWLKDVIFRPIVRLGPWHITKYVGAVACFGFVGLFQGMMKHQILYVLLNTFQYCVEHLLTYLFLKTWIGMFMEKTFSATNLRRIIGFVGGISFFLSTYSFVCFQFEIKLTNAMYIVIFSKHMNLFLTVFFMYAHSQISITTCGYLSKRKLKTC